MAVSDYVDPSDLSAMSRGGNILQKLGYDPDQLRMNPALQADMRAKLAGPYAATPAPPPTQVAQNSAPPNPNPLSQNGNNIAAPAGQPRLFNREQPSAPTPARPVPASLSAAIPTTPTPASMAGTPTQGSAAVSPSGEATPSPEVTNERKAVDNLLAPEPAVPDTSKQDAMIDAKSIPINPHTNIGGKEIYKEGWKGELARGAKGALTGFAIGGIPGAAIGAVDPEIFKKEGYGAPNKDYQIDDAARQGELATAQRDKATKIEKFKQLSDQRNKQDVSSNDAGTISNTAAKLPNETANAEPKTEAEALSRAALETDPVKKAAYTALATQMHNATVEEKPPRQPGEHPSAELQEYEDRKAAALRENGGKPLSAAQLAALGSAGGKGAPTDAGFQALLNQRDGDYKTWQKNRDAEMAKARRPSDVAAIEAKYAGQQQDLQDTWNQRLSDYDPQGILKHSAAAPPAAAAAATAAPIKTRSGATVTIGQAVTDGKRTGTVTGVSKNGKPIVKWE